MLKADHIQKTFGSRAALDDVSLTLESGHIFGLLGTNGAGKSTLLRAMAGCSGPIRDRFPWTACPFRRIPPANRPSAISAMNPLS